MESIYSIC